MLVDLVVEGNHLVGELDVALLQRAHGAADGLDDPLPLLLELCFDSVEGLVDRHPAERYTRGKWGHSPSGDRHQFDTTSYPTVVYGSRTFAPAKPNRGRENAQGRLDGNRA